MNQRTLDMAVLVLIFAIFGVVSWKFGFEAGLVAATAITGLFWLFDKLLWARSRESQAHTSSTVEFCRSFFPVILAVLLLRSFVVEPFRIPSSSMVPSLLVGDFVAVNKFRYGLRLPVLHTKILDLGEPKRGDVVVFRWPVNPKIDFIKRVVGLPGDTVLYKNKHLLINGKAVPLRKLGVYHGESVPSGETDIEFREHLGNHVHKLLQVQARAPKTFRFEVPKGQYLVMGDNRDHSLDSRYWGFVPEHALVGPAFLIWMSVDWHDFVPRFSRIFHWVE